MSGPPGIFNAQSRCTAALKIECRASGGGKVVGGGTDARMCHYTLS